MTNSTTQYTDVDGTSLQTLCQNLTTWGDDREGVPDLRGDDTLIPYRAGRKWVAKVPDSRTIGLKGWVVGADADGNIGDVEVFRKNWRLLRRLLWTPGRQFALTKRWLADDGTTVLSATAMAEYAGGLTPKMTGPNRATFNVDLLLADPFFYGEPVVVDLDLGTNAIVEHEVLGDHLTTKVDVHMEGPLTSGRVTVTDLDPQMWVRYLDLPDGSVVDIDVDRFRAVEDDGAATTLTAGNVRHDGSPFWLPVVPGARTFALTATAGTGTARVTYRPAWL